jgi:hypothetical protein
MHGAPARRTMPTPTSRRSARRDQGVDDDDVVVVDELC